MSTNGKKRRKGSDKREPETIDGQTGTVDPAPATGKGGSDKPKRRIDLSTLRDVRLEMAYVYREMDAGTIEDAAGTKRVYVLRQIADVITLAELEKRIQDLEDQHVAGAIQGQRRLPARTLN